MYMTGIIPDNSFTKGLNLLQNYVIKHWEVVGILDFTMIFLAVFSKEKVYL